MWSCNTGAPGTPSKSAPLPRQIQAASLRTDMKASDKKYERIRGEAKTLPMRLRLSLMEDLKALASYRNSNGLRFSLESVSEYKRAKKSRAQHEPLVRWLASFGPSDVFFDVGANIGGLSLMAAHLHDGRVPTFAFEPASDSFAALVRNIAANNLTETITPIQVALFDETGIRPFYRSRVGAGSAFHAVGQALNDERQPFTPAAVEQVLAFRLDDLVRVCRLPRPTRIKLDVDGFEHKVMAGAAELLSGGPCEVYSELVQADPDDRHPEQVTDFLRGLGYERTQVIEHRRPGTFPRVFDALFVRR